MSQTQHRLLSGAGCMKGLALPAAGAVELARSPVMIVMMKVNTLSTHDQVNDAHLRVDRREGAHSHRSALET